MAPPTYDSSKHHIGLKERGTATNYGFMLQGGYVKEGQREAIGAPEFGGATDLLGQAPSVSRWTQDDFIGGMYAYNWGRDDAMFAECKNFIPSQQARSLISCPPLYLKYAFDPDSKTNYTTDTPIEMFMVAGSIYTVWPNGIMRYQIGTGTMTEAYGVSILLDADGTETIVSAEYDSNTQRIWILTNDTTASAQGSIQRIKTDLTLDTITTWNWPTVAGSALNAYGMTMRDSGVIANIGHRLYSGLMPKDLSSATGAFTWTDLGRLPGRWRDSCPYNGMTYILTNDGSFRSNVVAFDGTSVLPIAQLPHSFYGKCIIEYAGRIFVGGTGTDVNGGEHYAELYEITGASVRQVRTFSPETRNYFLGGVEGEWPQSIDCMAVHEGLLWFPQKGKQLVAYDVSSDGFFGASDIQNANLKIAKMTAGRGRLWLWGVDSTDDTKHGIYRIAQPADSASLSTWNPTLVTSDFAFEPAMKKRWGKLRVMTRYGSCTSIEYSTDGGASWTSLSVTVSSSYGKIYYSDADLAAITPTEHIRFRFKLTVSGEAGDAITYHRELVAFTVSFAMLDSGKCGWSFTINNSEYVETRDAELAEATVQAQDVGDIASTLWGYWTNKTPLTFTDIGGSTYDVQLVSFRENMPVVGPNPSGETSPESLFAVTLLEV